LGQAKYKKEQFLKSHSKCCFCGGNELATTIDHVPSRACFYGRAYPEGFEFPACDKCNGSSSLDEQAFAFMCHLSDRNPDNYDKKQTSKLIDGIRNNQPHLIPKMLQSANEKRRALKQLGQLRPSGWPLERVPMAQISRDFDPILKRVTAKIALALYYRHKGKAAPHSHGLSCYCTQATNRIKMAGFEKVAKEFSFVERGWRSNLNFGDRFGYIWNEEENGEPDMFGMIAQFGQGMVICAMFLEGSTLTKEVNEEKWLTVSDILTS
jgi:hypothetical protein